MKNPFQNSLQVFSAIMGALILFMLIADIGEMQCTESYPMRVIDAIWIIIFFAGNYALGYFSREVK